MNTILALTSFFLGCLFSFGLFKRESNKTAHFIEQKPIDSTVRLELSGVVTGNRKLLKAINSLFDKYEEKTLCLSKEQEDLIRGLSGLSHDIRTPLTGAKGHIQLATMALTSNKTSEISSHLDSASERIDAVNHILCALSDYSHASDPDSSLSLQKVQLLPLVLEVLSGHTADFLEREWDPEVIAKDETIEITADPFEFKRIVDNLISNALLYGTASPKCICTQGSLTVLNKVATSETIDVDRMFERFYRADPSRAIPGSGLGLPTARQLAWNMGMDLTGETVGHSIEFSIIFQNEGER